MKFSVLVLGLVFFGLGLDAGKAAERVWVGLYWAENGPPAANARLAPPRLHEQLHEVFGFKHYELLKAQNVQLRNEWEQWFIPRRDFFIRLQPLPWMPDQPRIIDYEIYKDGFIVAKGRFEPREGTPLFINGPDFHEGRLILVLEARPPKPKPDDDDDD